MKRVILYLFIGIGIFIGLSSNVYSAENCFGAPNPVIGYGNCGCMKINTSAPDTRENYQGRCYWADSTPTGNYTVSQGGQDCRQNLEKAQICYVQAPTPTHNPLLGTPTPTVPPISNTNQGISGDQTVPAPGDPTWTPTPGLDFNNLIDNVSPGGIGGACVAGDISLNVLKQPDVVKDSGVSEDLETAQYIKNTGLNILELFRSANIFMKSFFNATATTEFCPLNDQQDVIPIFYSRRDANNNIDRSSKIDILLEEDRSIQFALNSSQALPDFTNALQNERFESNKLRIAQAFLLLKSTANMSIDKKKETIDEIQKILWGDGINESPNPSLSCACVSRVAAAIDQKDILGASIPRGEVLGTKTIAESCSRLPRLEQPSCIQELTASCANYTNESTCIASIEQSCPFTDVSCLINVKRFINNCKPLLDSKYASNNEYAKCVNCGLKESGTWTALGCFSSDFSTNVKKIFSILLGFGGLTALGCIIYASFIMQTSAGNPEKTKKAQELITSCIAGLILIIFSVFILRVLGVDILRIPGFI